MTGGEREGQEGEEKVESGKESRRGEWGKGRGQGGEKKVGKK